MLFKPLKVLGNSSFLKIQLQNKTRIYFNLKFKARFRNANQTE